VPFTFQRSDIPEVVLIEPQVFGDTRGFVMETYKQSDFAPFVDVGFVQEIHSKSRRGTLRGLHFQLGRYAQGKLVRVVSGEIFDVAVDIRQDSLTRGKWVGTVLSAENRRMVYIPPWCAHGFCVLSEDSGSRL
jgi:dTDP-4-dehydrorhamnose 3,5-epimerase